MSDWNFQSNIESHPVLQHLNEYHYVDPAGMRGQQVMDAGRVQFVQGSHVALSRAMSFTSDDKYCVAPIVSGSLPASFDFWAVGMNCCPGVGGSAFRCGEVSNTEARSGLRVVNVQQQQFYRLAVEQAGATFKIATEHPLFFTWVQDAAADETALWSDALTLYGVIVAGHLVLQAVLVLFNVLCCEKRDEALLLVK
jgi:hypothetical protein